MKALSNKRPFFKSKKSTNKIMIEFFIVLNLFWFISIFIHLINFGVKAAIMTFSIGVVSYITTFIIDVLVAISRKEKIKKIVFENFSYISAIIFALTLPAGTPLYVVIVGATVVTFISKYLFGGFGYNIFNPAAVGRVFVGIAFGQNLLPYNTMSNDLKTSSTITSSIDWSFFSLNNYSLSELFLGGYPSAIGESFFMFLLLIFIYFLFRRIINYRASFYYLLTIILSTLAIGFFIKQINMFEYMLLHLMSGAIMFAAVFMISDPITSGRRNYSKILFGIGAGFLTILIRINSNYPEGVIYSILIMNMLVPIFENKKYKLESKKIGKKKIFIACLIIFLVAINTLVAYNHTFDKKDNIVCVENEKKIDRVEIEEKL